MNRKALSILLLVFIALAGVGILPLSFVSLRQHSLNLYYESSTAQAPVDLTFYGSVSEYKQSSYGSWFSGLRGAFRGYRSISASVTLKIGEYEETKTVKPTVAWVESAGKEAYGCTVSARFTVPASKIVPYMELDENKTDRGSSSFTASYIISISNEPSALKFSGETTGPVYIQIVGDVNSYVPDPEPPSPSQDPPPEAPPEDLPLQDSSDKTEYGGSKLTSSNTQPFLSQISLPLLLTVTLVAVVLIYRGRK